MQYKLWKVNAGSKGNYLDKCGPKMKFDKTAMNEKKLKELGFKNWEDYDKQMAEDV